MKKLQNSERTIDDPIIKEGLCAVGTLEDSPDTKGLYFLVGGIGVQSYLPTSCRRPTSDLDIAVLRPLNYEDFKTFSRNIATYLQDKGYSVNTRKGQRYYVLGFESSDGDSCMIEFARRNPQNFEKVAKRLEREERHSRIKLVEGRDASYRVAGTEDIAVPKLVRCVNSFSRNPRFEADVSKRKTLSIEEIQKQLRRIAELREKARSSDNPEFAEELRFVADLYDIRILSEITGYNEHYLRTAASEWDALTRQSFERDLLVRAALPDLEKIE